jgi:Ca-activated chloride channel family protein
MKTVTEATGGFYATVLTQDDLIGQVLLAKSKIASEALHDVSLKISGVKTFEATDEAIGKIYRGQQVVVFGRYERGGKATVTLTARMTGEDKTYRTTFDFPSVDTHHPEIERLWALDRIETLEALQHVGRVKAAEAEQSIRQLGVTYQLVTDHTSMVVLTDESFAARGIERRNRERVAIERAAQAVRATQPAASARVDQHQPMFNGTAPSAGSNGAGGLDPVAAVITLAVAGLTFSLRLLRQRSVARQQ